MKISKRANQHNVELNLEYYTRLELRDLARNKKIFWLDSSKNVNEDWTTYNIPKFKDEYDINWRVFLNDMKEIKVVLKDTYYTTVAVANDGTIYYISLD